MNSTVKCWLIANFEIVLFWLTTIVGGIIFLIFASPKAEIFDEYFSVIFWVGIIVLVINTPTKSTAAQYGKYLVMVVVFILIWLLFKEASKEVESVSAVEKLIVFIFTWGGWVIFAITSAISGWLAYYTYKNIDEVVSYRMLYRNSDVSLFELTWKYTLDRFCNISVAIVTCTVWITLLILISFVG